MINFFKDITYKDLRKKEILNIVLLLVIYTLLISLFIIALLSNSKNILFEYLRILSFGILPFLIIIIVISVVNFAIYFRSEYGILRYLEWDDYINLNLIMRRLAFSNKYLYGVNFSLIAIPLEDIEEVYLKNQNGKGYSPYLHIKTKEKLVKLSIGKIPMFNDKKMNILKGGLSKINLDLQIKL